LARDVTIAHNRSLLQTTKPPLRQRALSPLFTHKKRPLFYLFVPHNSSAGRFFLYLIQKHRRTTQKLKYVERLRDLDLFRRGMGNYVLVDNLAGSNLYDDKDAKGVKVAVSTKKSHATMTLAITDSQPPLFRVRCTRRPVIAKALADGARGDSNS
jgi:hypothetical protein